MNTEQATLSTPSADDSSWTQQLLSWQNAQYEGLMQGWDKQRLLNEVCGFVERALPGATALVLRQRKTGRIEVVAAPRLDGARRREIGRLISEGQCGGPCVAVLASDQAFEVFEDVRREPRWQKVRHLCDPLGVVGCWSHVIRDGEGQPVGAFALIFDSPRASDALSEQLLAHGAHLAGLVIHTHQLTQLVRQVRDRDPLTGLYNRNRLQRDVEALFERGEPFGCLYLDLDHFKSIIDAHGHGVGDRVLVEVARRLEGCLMQVSGTLYRFGGDEFIMVTQVCSLPDPYAAMERLCADIIEAVQQPLQIDHHVFSLSVSIGIGCGVEAQGSYYELLRMADAALWAAKRAGRRTWRFFDRSMVETLEEDLQLEIDLQRALRNGELDVHYQPILDARTGEVVSFEALVRWRHPQLGVVRPDRFIAVAEKSGLIRQLDEQVLEMVLADLYAWLNELKDVDFTVAINLSALEFERQHVERLVAKVQDSNLASHIEFEMTETLMMEDTAETTALIHLIRESGIAGLAMDDFGTGYSSIGYLKKFSVDKLKIDRSLVRDIETDPSDLAIARAVCALGRALGLKVVAEGVETDQQRAMLVEEGVNLLQGYLFARPMPGEAVVPWLESRMKQCMLVD